MDLAKHWRQRAARYRLEGQRSRATGEVRFPPEPPQPGEAEDAWEPHRLSGRGAVYSYTVVHQPPEGYEGGAPYILALVRLEEGPLITAQLTDCDPEQATINMPVETATRKLREVGPEGLIVYGYKFRPLLNQ
jgi:hypothetical protein